jgi:2-polyprenyl-3-methyl-5-hydroxy-6-metoxy-1,4-benzoquinol methylase
MNYEEQQHFLMQGRIWGCAAVVLILTFSAGCLASFPQIRLLPAVEFGMAVIALAVFVFYVPDYLHLTVDATKRQRWEIKIRWRIVGAALVLGFLQISGVTGVLQLVAATSWLVAANLCASKLRTRDCSLYFWATDFVLFLALFLSGKMIPLLGAILVAASAHLSLVISEKVKLSWTTLVVISGALLLAIGWLRGNQTTRFFLAAVSLLLVSALATAFLVWRAQRHNAKNLESATSELVQFTGFPTQEIRRLWSVSNQQLAKNWESAALNENDAVGLADWYRENSQLYLFAISAYNLDYKRIRSNLKVLRFARGSCLDYGAGNGEIILELARTGHPVTYYDVPGETMRFAEYRALQRHLNVNFQHSKEGLRASSRERGFDTIFSFDVLEHLPDLPGELKFLSSLLNQDGLFVFDVPAGSTRAHPMHLNHNLCVRRYMQTLGLEGERDLLHKLPFRKEEKYFFRASRHEPPSELRRTYSGPPEDLSRQ